MKKLFVKKKKLMITGIVVVVLVVVAGVVITGMQQKSALAAESINTTETSNVELRTIVSSVSATGVIESLESQEITSTLTGEKISEIFVEVGDYVEAGDIIASFDTEDIETNLANAESNLAATQKKSSIDVSSAARNLEDATESRDITAERNNIDVADAWTAYEESITEFNTAEVNYYTAKGTTSTRKSETDASLSRLNSYNAAVNTAKNNFAGKLAELVTAYSPTYDFSDISITSSAWSSKTATDYVLVSNPADEAAIDIYLTALKSYQTDYNTYTAKVTTESAAYATYQQNYASAQSNESTLKSKYDSAQATVDSKLSAYNQLVRSQTDAARTNESTVTARQDSLTTAKLNSSTSSFTYEQQVSQYKEQLENGTIKSPISGIITAVNMSVGDVYNGQTLITVEDDSNYVISTEIDEYNISKIKEGMQVLVKTNATGETQMEGTVIDVAPRATTSAVQTSTGGDVTYTVKISLDTENEDLRMDMTAKLSIILDSSENTLVVPYDAVLTDEDGKTYVEVVTETGSETNNEQSNESSAVVTTKIYVTIGLESDYYIEVISDELKEGMKVLMPVTESTNSISDVIGNQGPMGGF